MLTVFDDAENNTAVASAADIEHNRPNNSGVQTKFPLKTPCEKPSYDSDKRSADRGLSFVPIDLEN